MLRVTQLVHQHVGNQLMRSLAENQDVAGLHKMPTGIEGFDSITGGGLPRNRTSLIIGDPGGGKTVIDGRIVLEDNCHLTSAAPQLPIGPLARR